MEKINIFHYSTIILFMQRKNMSVKLVLIKNQEMSVIKNELEENYTHCQNEISSQDTLNFGICSGLWGIL